jgi:hypothetical protein
MHMKAQNIVTASEIGDYVFCRRAWWLKWMGLAPKNTPQMLEGKRAHEAVVHHVNTSQKNLWLAIAVVVFGLICLLFTFIELF